MADQSASASQPNHSNTKKLALQPGETSNLSFWIAQGFMLLATVIGVYLAGQQGLAQALAFDQIQSEKNNYYLRQSLKDELADNIVLVVAYTEALKSAGPSSSRRLELQLDTFVWESMKFSSATMETPSLLLGESRQFYRQTQDIYQKIQAGFYSAAYGGQLLLNVVEHMENSVLPAFDENISTLRRYLEQHEVEI